MRFRALNARVVFSLLAAVMLLTIGVLPAGAQEAPTPIGLGQPQTGAISLQNIAPSFVFSVNEPQSVQVTLDALTPGFVPALRLLNAVGELVQEIPNPGGAGRLQTVLVLPLPGAYTLQVSSANGFAGQFTVTLDQAEPPAPLALNSGLTGNLTAENALDRYVFTASPTGPLELLVTTEAPTDTQVILNDDAGNRLAQVSLRLTTIRLTIPPGTGQYVLSLQHGGAAAEPYQVLLRAADSLVPVSPTGVATAGATTAPPSVTPIPLEPLPTTGPCVVASFSGNRVNLRSGPGTNFSVLTQLNGNQIADVIGRLGDNSWYQVQTRVNPTIAWVATSVIRQGGDCSAVPVVAAPGQATPTPIVPTPSGSQPDLVISGVTVTPSTVIEDQAFSVNVTISNIGGAIATNVLLRAIFDPDNPVEVNTPVADSNIAGIDPGTSVTINFNGIIGDDAGQIDVAVQADPNNSIVEINEGNNNSGIEVNVIETTPDLVISDIDVDTDDDSTSVTVTVAVRNQGGEAAQNFEASVTFDPPNVGPQVLSWDDVGPGSTESKNIEVDLGSEDDYTVTVVVDPGNEIVELNEGNNQDADDFTIDN